MSECDRLIQYFEIAFHLKNKQRERERVECMVKVSAVINLTCIESLLK